MKPQKSKIFDGVRKKQGFFQTKAQGLPLQIIIIAAILLIVVIVLVAIFSGKTSLFTKGLSECKGNCINPIDNNCPLNQAKIQGECPEGKICCLPIENK